MGFDGHFAQQQFQETDVRFGSLADIEACPRDVRFTPKSRHSPNDCLKLNQLKEHHSAGFQSYLWESGPDISRLISNVRFWG